MKKFIFVLFLFLSNHARSEWTLIYSDIDLASYVDLSAVDYSRKYLQIWHLLNFNSAQLIGSSSSLSVKMLWEIDCLGERSRNLAAIWYVDEMGEGYINYSDSSPTKWKNNIPHTLTHHLWFVMCSTNFI